MILNKNSGSSFHLIQNVNIFYKSIYLINYLLIFVPYNFQNLDDLKNLF
jgi:hypothetical protein